MTSVFWMWEPRRKNLIAEHRFYVLEGKKRLTDQFSDAAKLEREADEYSQAWLEKAGQHFDPDRHDAGSFYEQAYDEGIQHYQALDELGNSARLALISGMYHLWEKSLREWMTSNDCIGYIQQGENLPKAIWKSNFADALEVFECVNLFQQGCVIRESLDDCRMVVNTYKHGAGPSETDLKAKRPELFDQYGWRATSSASSFADLADYTDLYVADGNIDEFADAIEKFWNAIPEHITVDEFQPVPSWFLKAHEKDVNGAANGS